MTLFGEPLTKTSRLFKPRLTPTQIDQQFDESIGAYANLKPEKVRLRFDGVAARLVQEQRRQPSQKFRDLPDGSMEMTLNVGLSPELDRWILSWMPNCVVLESEVLKVRVGEVLRQAIGKSVTGSSREMVNLDPI